MGTFRIAVVAPGGRIAPEVAEQALALAASHYPTEALQIHFHPQCFLSSGHFAGDDGARVDAFVEVANDPDVDAVWFARGGYGACRMAESALARLGPAASAKTYLGYSDTGALLGALYRAGIGWPAHGPMPGDIVRDGGEAAVLRALGYLIRRDPEAVEPAMDPGLPHLAYNMAILSSVLGTALEPPLAGHLLLLEEVGEYMYRLDRYLFHITSSAAVRRVAGIRLGRVSATLANVPEFGAAEEAVTEHWCRHAGIAYLGRADVGHDVDNKVVPFGRP
ncbi:MAG: LD-carboxypeptidase [Caulobacteraceae bacterium]|nr:LD-carboxypeptidase [Caulobacteraceae bacterium]